MSEDIPCGIYNMGNTCYINTIVQCLGFCPRFREQVEKYQDSNQQHLAWHLFSIYNYIYKRREPCRPYEFLKQLSTLLGSIINIFDQNDINEFYALFIDKICSQVGKRVSQQEFLSYLTDAYTPDSNQQYEMQKKKMCIHWYDCNKGDYSALKTLLHGQLISQIICGKCKKIHHNYEMFLNVMLSIPRDRATLYECLDEYFAEECINDDEMYWECDGCKSKSKSIKVIKNWRNPDIMVITLKRFSYDLQKVMYDVEIPEILDMSTFSLVGEQDVPLQYKLRGIAYHGGSYCSGHYIAVGCFDDKWRAFDDENILDISNKNEVASKGYMYFYERI